MATQKAQLKYLKITPRKVRLVADLIKGLPVNEAEAQLIMQKKRAAKSLLKLLRSAISNAKNTKQIEASQLFIKSVFVNEGPMLKRYLPRARGMATPIQKKMSHVSIILEEGSGFKTPRFSIIVPKKGKLPKKDVAKKTKKTKEGGDEIDEKKQTSRPQKPGFFKKVFSRKSGMGK